LALIVALLASALLYQYISGVNLGINTFIVSDAQSGHPGRMSPQSAGTFLLLAVILLGIRARKSLLSLVVDGLTLCLGLAMLTFAFGYLYVVFHLFSLTTENRMGPLTVCGIFLLTIVVFIYRAPNGIFAVFLSDSIAGQTSRIAAPLTLGLPFLLAVLGVLAGKTSVMRNEYSNALATATVALLAFCLLLVMAHRTLGLERSIRDLSLRDELTHLYNRRGFYVLASQALLLAQRTKSPLSMLYFDMDDLKQVNDSLGHEVGSELLREMGQILSSHFRQTDVLARIGGDEFVVVANVGLPEVSAIAQRLETAIAAVNTKPDRVYAIGFSYGAVTTDTHMETLDDLLRKADQMMYQAKHGKGRRSIQSPPPQSFSP
jgi:diguanylate cyclase (GGDEF)-like protein